MISLNLLPDIKKEYLKTQRTKRVFIFGSVVVSGSFIALVVLMSLYVYGVQRLRINNTQTNIDNSVDALTSAPDFDKIVTVQNQLIALPELHDTKPIVSRVFDWLTALVPNDVDLNSLKLEVENSTIEMKGTGDDLKAINVLVDTLKNAQFKYGGSSELYPAFHTVVLDRTGVDEERTTYKIIFDFDPIIFDATVTDLELSVPNITSTRSETERPKALYESSNTEGLE